MRSALSLALIFVLLFGTLLLAAEQADQQQHASCNFCGMDRSKFAHSRMLVNFDDGSVVGTCSLHCTACALALSIGRDATTIKAGDFNSKQLIDAETAFWVLGGKKPGVMTSRAKWAFADRTEAEQFISSNGGNIVDFEQALHAASEDLYGDSLKMQKKRKEKKLLQ